jgi:hypothetical protein
VQLVDVGVVGVDKGVGQKPGSGRGDCLPIAISIVISILADDDDGNGDEECRRLPEPPASLGNLISASR